MPSLSAGQRGQRFLKDSPVVRFQEMPFSELGEIYEELRTNSFTSIFFEAVAEIYNERNEFNNYQLLIEG